MTVFQKIQSGQLQIVGTSNYPITGTTTSGAGGSFQILGNFIDQFVPTRQFVVSGSVGNNGTYTTASSSFNPATDFTTIVVTGSVPTTSAAGSIALTYSSLDANKVIILNGNGLLPPLDGSQLINISGGGGGGVTSVNASDGSTSPIYTVTGGPITSTGSLTFTLNNQTTNKVFASPNGSTGQPTFRALAVADLPTGIPNANLANSSITVTAGSGIGVAGSPVSLGGSVTISNNGVTSLASATGSTTSGTSVSGSTGAVTISGVAFTSSASGMAPASGGGTTNFLRADGTWAVPVSGSGTVTSVGFADSSTTAIYAVSGAPVTTSGTIHITLNTQSANLVFAGPTTGAAAQPTFRALVNADLPASGASAGTFGQVTVNTQGVVTAGTVITDIAHGGTGVSTVPTNGQILVGNGTNYTVATLGSGTGISTTVGSGTLQINNTGVTSLASNSGATTGGTSVSAATGGVTISGVAFSSSVQGMAPASGGGTTNFLRADGSWAAPPGSGVSSFSAGSTGFTPNSATTGAVTLAGTLAIANGGTGQTSAGLANQILTSNGSTLSFKYPTLAQNSQTTNYTLALTDQGGQVYLSGSTASQTVTIPANGTVAFPIGTAVTIINDSTQTWTVAINTDVLVLAGTGGTGTRTLAQFGVVTVVKVTATRWYISGTGVT